MITIEVSIVINRPLEEVFAFLSDLENNLKWRPGQIEAKKTSAGPIGVGTTYRMINNVLGRRIEGEAEVTDTCRTGNTRVRANRGIFHSKPSGSSILSREAHG